MVVAFFFSWFVVRPECCEVGYTPRYSTANKNAKLYFLIRSIFSNMIYCVHLHGGEETAPGKAGGSYEKMQTTMAGCYYAS